MGHKRSTCHWPGKLEESLHLCFCLPLNLKCWCHLTPNAQPSRAVLGFNTFFCKDSQYPERQINSEKRATEGSQVWFCPQRSRSFLPSTRNLSVFEGVMTTVSFSFLICKQRESLCSVLSKCTKNQAWKICIQQILGIITLNPRSHSILSSHKCNTLVKTLIFCLWKFTLI